MLLSRISLSSAFYRIVLCGALALRACTATGEEESSSCAASTSIPRALIGEEFVEINEERFPKYFGTYPPDSSGNADIDGLPYYYVLNADKSVLYIPNFLNQTAANQMKEFCTSGERFIRSPDREKGEVRFVSTETVITRFIDKLFPGHEVEGQGNFRIIRDSDLEWTIARPGRSSGRP